MDSQNKSKGQITDEEVRELETVKLDNKTDFLLGEIAEGDAYKIPMGGIKAIVYGTDNVHTILAARKKELRTINLYVCTYGLDGGPCVTLYFLFTKYFSDKIFVIENLDSKGDKIRIVAKDQVPSVIDLMTMCMGHRERIRFLAIMDDIECGLFRQVLLLLREWTSYDILKECGNDIHLLISKLSLLTDGRLFFSRTKPKPLKIFPKRRPQ